MKWNFIWLLSVLFLCVSCVEPESEQSEKQQLSRLRAELAAVTDENQNLRADLVAKEVALNTTSSDAKTVIEQELEIRSLKTKIKALEVRVLALQENGESADSVHQTIDRRNSNPSDEVLDSGPVVALTIQQALATKRIREVTVGGGLTSAMLTLNSKPPATIEDVEVGLDLEVFIPVGTFLTASTPGIQTMIVTSARTIRVSGDGSEVSLRVSVACTEMDKSAPGPEEVLRVSLSPPPEQLRKLLTLPYFSRQSVRIKQFAVWTITDKPAKPSDFSAIGSLIGQGPSANEMQIIRDLFDQAGIRSGDYSCLKDTANRMGRTETSFAALMPRQLWIDKFGRSIDAELMAIYRNFHGKRTCKFRLSNGRLADVPLDRLSVENQRQVEEYEAGPDSNVDLKETFEAL